MKNKNLVLFIGVGFIVTIAIWGFVGGCGTLNDNLKTGPVKGAPVTREPVIAKPVSAQSELVDKGPIFEKTPASRTSKKEQIPAFQDTTGKAVRQTYIVQQGDTLWNISKKFGVSVQTIKDVNSLKGESISIGQSLVISRGAVIPETKLTEVKLAEVKKPEPKEIKGQEITPVVKKGTTNVTSVSLQPQTKLQAKPGTVVYIVRKDDSLWRIAQVHGTTQEKIAELNGLSKNAQLMPGKEILVPSNE